MYHSDFYYDSWHVNAIGLMAGGQHRLHYKSWGDPFAENIILCVHGLTRNSHDFNDLALDLSVYLGCRVIALDMAGRGQSDWLPTPQSYHMSQYCQDVHVLIQTLKSEAKSAQRGCYFHWVGTSMGGLIGIGLAAAGVALQSLFLNDVGPFISGQVLSDLSRSVAKTPLNFADVESAYQWASSAWADFGLETQAQWQKMVMNVLVPESNGGLKFHYDPQIISLMVVVMDLETSIPDLDMWSSWQKITQPVFVFRGEKSSLLTSETLAKMFETTDHIESYICPNTGHAPMLMKQTEIRLIPKWLQLQTSRHKYVINQ